MGAGTGAVSRRILQRQPGRQIVALEPAENIYPRLESFAKGEPRLEAYHSTLAEFQSPEMFDTVLYLNVLEHIEQDAAEIKLVSDVLRPGGALLVFVPAFESLYSDLDYKSGHYRRYRRAELQALVGDAGLQVERLYYFDLLGLISYVVLYKWMGRTVVSDFSVGFYDRLVVPLSRAVQWLSGGHLPFGKNLLLVAIKPDQAK